jgi:hypothetical protein
LNTLEDAFTRLLARQPTDKEKQDLFRVRDALNLKNNDSLWLLLMALGHYETLYAKFPNLITRAATEVMAKSKDAADAEFKAAAARGHRDLSEAVAESARDIAARTASPNQWQWLTAGVIIALLAFAGVTLWVRHVSESAGYSAGRLQGYTSAREENAAASWANTPEGQLALGLARAGSISLPRVPAGAGPRRRISATRRPIAPASKVGGCRRECEAVRPFEALLNHASEALGRTRSKGGPHRPKSEHLGVLGRVKGTQLRAGSAALDPPSALQRLATMGECGDLTSQQRESLGSSRLTNPARPLAGSTPKATVPACSLLFDRVARRPSDQRV